MQVPESGILQVDISDLHVVGFANEDQPRTFDVEILGFTICRDAPAELEPERLAAAIESALAGDAKMIARVGVKQRRQPRLEVALDARHRLGIVFRIGRAFENRVLFQMKVDVRLEEDRAAEKNALRNDHSSAAGRGDAIDGGLDASRI